MLDVGFAAKIIDDPQGTGGVSLSGVYQSNESGRFGSSLRPSPAGERRAMAGIGEWRDEAAVVEERSGALMIQNDRLDRGGWRARFSPRPVVVANVTAFDDTGASNLPAS